VLIVLGASFAAFTSGLAIVYTREAAAENVSGRNINAVS
jgi:hypothetical protein